MTENYAIIHLWSGEFGLALARTTRRQQHQVGGVLHTHEVFIAARRERGRHWKATDQAGDVLDIPVIHRGGKRDWDDKTAVEA